MRQPDAGPTPDSESAEAHELMKPEEVADYFRITPYTLQTWLRKDFLKITLPNGEVERAFKMGGAWRIPRSVVLGVARAMAREGLAPPTTPQSRRRK